MQDIWFEIMQYLTPLSIQSLLQTCKDMNKIKDRIWEWKAKQMKLEIDPKWKAYLNRCVISKYYHKCFFCLSTSYMYTTEDYRYSFSKANCYHCTKCKDKQLKCVSDSELKKMKLLTNDFEFFLVKRLFIEKYGFKEWIHYQFVKRIKKSE